MSEEIGKNPLNNGTKTGKDPTTGKFVEGNNFGEGKPKGTRSFTTKVREALEKIAEGKDYTYEEAFIKSILKKGIVDGDASTQKLIWNYLDGLPMQRTDITSGGKVIPLLGGQSNGNNNNSDKEIIGTEEEI